MFFGWRCEIRICVHVVYLAQLKKGIIRCEVVLCKRPKKPEPVSKTKLRCFIILRFRVWYTFSNPLVTKHNNPTTDWRRIWNYTLFWYNSCSLHIFLNFTFTLFIMYIFDQKVSFFTKKFFFCEIESFCQKCL